MAMMKVLMTCLVRHCKVFVNQLPQTVGLIFKWKRVFSHRFRALSEGDEGDFLSAPDVWVFAWDACEEERGWKREL